MSDVLSNPDRIRTQTREQNAGQETMGHLQGLSAMTAFLIGCLVLQIYLTPVYLLRFQMCWEIGKEHYRNFKCTSQSSENTVFLLLL